MFFLCVFLRAANNRQRCIIQLGCSSWQQIQDRLLLSSGPASVQEHNKPSSSLINFYGCQRGHSDTCLTAHSSLFHPSTREHLSVCVCVYEQLRQKQSKWEKEWERRNMDSTHKAATLNRSTFPLLWHQNLTEVGDFAHFFRHSPSKMQAKVI